MSKPLIINITSASAGSVALVNPPVEVYKDSTVDFNVSNESLAYTVQGTKYSAFEFNFYTDQACREIWNTSFVNTSFEVKRTGSVGIDTGAKVTLTVDDNIPEILYYKLDPVEVSNLPTIKSEINIDDEVDYNNQFATKTSLYNGTYRVSSGTGNTQFSYSINRIPEKTSYLSTDNAFITYETDCTHTTGPIAQIEIKDGGKNYYNLSLIHI